MPRCGQLKAKGSHQPTSLCVRIKAADLCSFRLSPLVARFAEGKLGDLSYSLRAKFFDYGVISLRYDFPFAGAWADLEDIASRIRRNEELLAAANQTVARICDELNEALDDRHAPLVEDYLIIEVDRFEPRLDAELLLHDHSEALGNILLGESGSLSQGEIEESLRTRFSYYADDLTIVQWDTAFIYDRRESSDAIADILEFAKLSTFRAADLRRAARPRARHDLRRAARSACALGARAAEADLAANVRYLIVDVLELIDRSSNALKVVGDAYYARSIALLVRASAWPIGSARSTASLQAWATSTASSSIRRAAGVTISSK